MHRTAIAAVLLLPVSLSAQWLKFRTPGIPRTADGAPNLTAPTPRTPDGKPDLSGLWRPELNPYYLDLIQNVKDEKIFRPEAEAMFMKRVEDFRRDNPVTHCLPAGPMAIFAVGSNRLYRIMQSPAEVALLYEGTGSRYRQIFMDGRELPKDPNPSWLGYSVGRWEGDTLVVETAGFNDRTWLDMVGHPHSEELRVTEKFRRLDFGHMRFEITFNDPKTLTGPLTRSLMVDYAPDTEMLEDVCAENERDTAHLVGTAKSAAQLSPAVLDNYTGTYEFREGPPAIDAFFGRTQTVTLNDGKLWLNAIPLIPQSKSVFDSSAAAIEFFTDANGSVTHLALRAAEGDARYDRKR